MSNQLSVNEARRSQTDRLLVSYLDKLPMLPNVAAATRLIGGRSRLAADRLEELAHLDPTLALRLCFLSKYGHAEEGAAPLSVPAIIIKAGTSRALRELAKLGNATPFLPKRAHVRELWLHSIQVALAARYFAHLHPRLGVGDEEAYLCGLMHDLGRFIIMTANPEAFAELEARGWETGPELVAAETEILGYNHAELGALACAKWQLPPLLSTVIRHHHGERLPAGEPASVIGLLQLVKLADAASFMMCKHPDMVAASDARREALLDEQGALRLLRSLSIPIDHLTRVVTELHRKSIELTDLLLDQDPEEAAITSDAVFGVK